MHLALPLPSLFARPLAFLPAQRHAVPAVAVVRRLLAPRALHREAGPLGRTVHCIAGSVWLTHDGDPRDVVLRAGQSHTCDRASALIVQALEDAAIAIVPAVPA